MPELAKIDASEETLVDDNRTSGDIEAEVERKLQEDNQNKQSTETVDEATMTQEEATDVETETVTGAENEVLEEEPQKQPATAEIYKQALKDAFKLINQNQNANQPKELEAELTNEELLEEFVKDPNGFIDKHPSTIAAKKRAAELENQQALSIARGNREFTRLEPVVNKYIEENPEFNSFSPLKKYHNAFRVVQQLEAEHKAFKVKSKAEVESAKKTKAKVKAATSTVAPSKTSTAGTKVFDAKAPNVKSGDVLKELNRILREGK